MRPRRGGGLRFLALLGVGVLGLLTYNYFFGDAGRFAVRELAATVEEQRRLTEQLGARNERLTSEVMALRQGPGPIEARARTDLGMVVRGETFYVLVDGAASAEVEAADGP